MLVFCDLKNVNLSCNEREARFMTGTQVYVPEKATNINQKSEFVCKWKTVLPNIVNNKELINVFDHVSNNFLCEQ